MCSAAMLLALSASLKTEKEPMSPLRLVTFPHLHTTSPREVARRVAEERPDSKMPDVDDTSVEIE